MAYTISGTVVGATGPLDGATIYAWKASRFSGVPAAGAAAPAGFPDAGPITSGETWGAAGAYQIAVPTSEAYYLQVIYGSSATVWLLTAPVPVTIMSPLAYTSAGAYNPVVPTGATHARIVCVGGGGGGGGGGSTSSISNQAGGGGGGGGEAVSVLVSVTPGDTLTVSVAAAAAGGAGGGSGGNAGAVGTTGNTSYVKNGVGTYLAAARGGGLGYGSNANSSAAAYGGFVGASDPNTSAGTIGCGGMSGQYTEGSIMGSFGGAGGGAANSTHGGGGGSAQQSGYLDSNVAPGGGGASATSAGGNGQTATAPGSGGGGGGGGAPGGAGGNGGAGAPGRVEIEWLP